ncbi:hypothetical protein [Phytomonospora endophytica]|uniref:Uncharacterized protein n=1 Tax=Phytomonospora endophytica TaxID=714109 RepID=A0A841FGV7_9ACTN|nr:hypothetical protein [Phytomonospora endophytica]MBB6033078.1 hypothetical protein [Phytomonospora endophytica]GIG65305.1 hypothetical protein Pen01_16000 [Phytomonospora endophytica]
MRLQLCTGVSESDVDDEAAYGADLVEGARFAAARHGFAAWDEPVPGTFHRAHVDDIGRLRRAAAHLAVLGRVPEAPGSLFDDEIVERAWTRGPGRAGLDARAGASGRARDHRCRADRRL